MDRVKARSVKDRRKQRNRRKKRDRKEGWWGKVEGEADVHNGSPPAATDGAPTARGRSTSSPEAAASQPMQRPATSEKAKDGTLDPKNHPTPGGTPTAQLRGTSHPRKTTLIGAGQQVSHQL